MKSLFPRLNKNDFVWISLILLLYLALNLSRITSLPIFVDEALYLRWAQIAWHDANWRFISLTDGKQPLYIWFVIPFMKLISDPLVAGRVASVFSGIFTIAGLFLTGTLLKSKRTGYIAALLGLFSPFLYFYNRFGVMESLLTAFGIWILFVSLIQSKLKRLDLSMILGILTGLSMIVKSSALFYLLLIPFSYISVIKFNKSLKKDALKFLLLYAVTATLAIVIYNVQRLSPWMHVISDKNSFFTVPYSDIFKEPARLINNFSDIYRWHSRYTTTPVLLFFIYGLYKLFKSDFRKFLTYSSWIFAPLFGTALIARLYAPRYIAFITPFILLPAALGLGELPKKFNRVLIHTLVLIYPIYMILTLNLTPNKFPFTKVDEGYINGWSAGYGVKEISEFMLERASVSENKVSLYTEGTFGILPHGVELYVDGKTTNLEIIGIYPINVKELPPYYVKDRAVTNETYFILNNTEIDFVPETLELVSKYDKAFDTSMRLYKVKN